MVRVSLFIMRYSIMNDIIDYELKSSFYWGVLSLFYCKCARVPVLLHFRVCMIFFSFHYIVVNV